MMTNSTLSVLVVNSSSRVKGSVSRQMTDRLSQRLLAENPTANVVERDLAHALPTVSEDWIGANFTPTEARSDTQVALLAQSDDLVTELRTADVLLIGLPIYNFGVPTSLKAWIDLICRAGETFRYTEAGPEGLLKNKRAIVTVASGGVAVGSPMDHATTYLSQVLAFIGITDVTYVSATGLALDAEATIKSANDQIDGLDLQHAA